MRVEAPIRAKAAWTERRRRASELAERYPHAAQQLGLYAALLDVQEPAFHDALDRRPEGWELPAYVAERILPRVVDCSVVHGPSALAEAALHRWRGTGGAELIGAWLRDAELDPVSRYLARASASPVLEALGRGAGLDPGDTDDGRRCPICGGLPQVSYLPGADEALLTAPRHLVCSRCQHAWIFARMTCAGCGEQSGSKLPIYGESERFPHLRVDACDSCGAYLVTVDLRKAPDAVPIVDELAAVPLDLYAREQGKHKIVPNLMGM
jgi:Protein involved in formate dehydrogenase formation